MDLELEKQLRATYADMTHDGRLNEIIRLQKLLAEVNRDLGGISKALDKLGRVR